MRYLLDTHVLLWAAIDPKQLHKETRKLIENHRNELLFSVVSLWELIIKQSLNRPDFQVDVNVLRRGLIANNYIEVEINSKHVLMVATLPTIHKDPFDRLLLAQSLIEDAALLTADTTLAEYPVSVKLIKRA